MRQLPALFSTPMVKAILENRKKMTRRTKGLEKVNECPDEWICIDTPQDSFNYSHHFQNINDKKRYMAKSSYAIGDQIYVREKFETDTDGTVKFYAGNIEVENNTAYRELTKWSPSIHMPKESARIWLECTGVRCDRLQDITEADAIAEGIVFDSTFKLYGCPVCGDHWHKGSDLLCKDGFFSFAKDAFQSLWHSINSVESWNKNPWVFVYSFKKLDQSSQSLPSPDNKP